MNLNDTVTLQPVQTGYQIDADGPFEITARQHLSDGSMLVVLHLRHTGKPPCWIYGQQRRAELRIIDLRLTQGQDGRLARNELYLKLQNREGAIYE